MLKANEEFSRLKNRSYRKFTLLVKIIRNQSKEFTLDVNRSGSRASLRYDKLIINHRIFTLEQKLLKLCGRQDKNGDQAGYGINEVVLTLRR